MTAEREFHVVWVREGKGTGLSETETGDASVAYKGAAVVLSAP